MSSRIRASFTTFCRPFGSHAEPGILRYRVADSEAPLRLLLHRDGRLEAELPVPAPGAWAEFTVEGSFRSLHLEVVLHDAERLGQEQAP